MTFDFKTGTWSSGHPSTADMIVAGDWAPIRDFAPLIEQNPESLYGDLLPVIREADLSLVNLEAPLSDNGEAVCKSGAVFKGNTRHVSGLSAVPFDAVTLANNHMFDFGVGAFRETVDTLEKNNIRYLGAGMNKEEAAEPLLLTANGTTVAIVNCSEGEDLTAAGKGPGVLGWDIPLVCTRIQKLKKEADAVIAVVHCGLEYIPFAPTYVIRAFTALAEAGADAVIGHHPHVPQGMFFHENTPIFCSLGNFIFYQPTSFYWRKLGYMVRLGVSEKGVTDLELVPYRIHDKGISGLTPDEKTYFLTRFREISSPLSTEQGALDAWNGFIDYYGSRGFKEEVARILEKMDADPGKGAAMFRNRLTTAQHFYHWKDLLTRTVEGKMGTAPGWGRTLAEEWLTRTL
ncbi:MAG: CapA family protein [Desulfobacterales bacterium]|nr:CapA family protein [Desulfobacterales bacterium]